jgi:aminopeptidase YwaD
MKKIILIILLIILILGVVIKFTYPSLLHHFTNINISPENVSIKPGPSEKTSDYQKTLARLAKLKGRAAGSSYEKEAASILAREFVNLNLEPLPRDNSFYFQTFPVPQRESYVRDGRQRFRGVGEFINSSQNVFGFLPGENVDKILIFTAHYDGQGVNNNQIYESANDNLSGIYILLNIANALTNRPNRNLSYLFVAFGAEEIGLYGSEFFLRNLPLKKDELIGVVNFDTVSTENEKMLLQSFSKNEMVEKTERALLNYGFRVNSEFSKLRTSDHYHFSAAGLNALTVAADDWLDENHTPQDTFDNLNFSMLDQLSEAIVDMALTMDEEEPFNK